MPITGKYFPSQSTSEKVFLILRRHWFTYVAFLIIAIIMIIPLLALVIYFFSNLEVFDGIFGNLSIIAGSAYSLSILALLLYGFIDYYLDIYIVTNQRIVDIEQNGFFKRGISELHLYQVQDVKASVKGALPTLMHYGDIHIQTAAERENFVFNSIPNPYRVSKIIVDLHEAQLEDARYKEEFNKGSVEREKSSAESVDGIRDFNSLDIDKFGLARKRTKEFLGGKKLVETDFDEDIMNQIEDGEKAEILKQTDQHMEKDKGKENQKTDKIKKNLSNHQNHDQKSDEIDIVKNNNKVSDKPSNEIEVEIKENEEIDI